MICRRYVTLTDPTTNRQVRRLVRFGSLGKDSNGHGIFYNDGKLTHRKYLSYKLIAGYGMPEYPELTTYTGPYYSKEHTTTVSNIEGATVNIPYNNPSTLTMDYSFANNLIANDEIIENGTDDTVTHDRGGNTWTCHAKIIDADESASIDDTSDDSSSADGISMKYVLNDCSCGTIYYDIDTGCHYIRFNYGNQKWVDVSDWINSMNLGYNKSSTFILGRGYPNENTSKGILDSDTETVRSQLKSAQSGWCYVDVDDWNIYRFNESADDEFDWTITMPTVSLLNDKTNAERPEYLIDITFKSKVEINEMFKTIDRDGAYAEGNEAVMHSLNQKLSILEGEIWNRIDKGWPLMNKSSKLIYDTYLLDTISNHPKVVSIKEFQSSSENRRYSAYVRIETIYGTTEVAVSK